MAAHLFTVSAANIAVTSTAKSVLMVKAPTNVPIKIHDVTMSFDGVDSTKAAGLVELCTCDFGGAGTNTAATPVDVSGRSETIQSTGAYGYSAEPTTLTVAYNFDLASYNGYLFLPFKDWVIAGGKGLVIRVTMDSGVSCNFSGTIRAEE